MAQEQSLLCSDLSKSVNEPLYGSAPLTDTWLLLEYPSLYGAKAFEESDLDVHIKSHLATVQKFLPNPRLVLVRRGKDLVSNKINFFLAFSTERQSQLFHVELGSYEELLNIEFEAYLAGKPATLDNLQAEPIFIVCTNGKRDRCCAKYGLPLYDAITSYDQDNVWQSSHVGGHRFAGNLVCLPHGIYYGRIPPEQGIRVIDAYRSRSLVMEYYRGRACYSAAGQAAEYYLRTHTGIVGVDEIHLVEEHELDKDHWSFTFQTSQGKNFQLRIHREVSDYAIFESCTTPEKRVQQSLYELQDIKEAHPAKH